MLDLFEITLADEIAEVEREIRMRREVYARRVKRNQMRPEDAERRTRIMESVLHRLLALRGTPQAVRDNLAAAKAAIDERLAERT